MKRISLVLLVSLVSIQLVAQTTKRVCFLGNSYIYTNDMPGLVSNMATADGNTLIKDQNTPGGYTLEGHSTNATSLTKIDANAWDFVVLQDQSQMPSFPWSQVTTDVFPFAEILCDSIRSANACAIPLFFDTWGRQNGDPQWDSIDTFTEMNQRLYNAYAYMADANNGWLAPVGIAYEHLANDMAPAVSFASLYVGDESHPTMLGSYLSACVFYELIFNETAIGNTYLPAGVNSTQAAYLQNVAHHVIHEVDSVQTNWINPEADFSFSVDFNEVNFTDESPLAYSWEWNFGDGTTSTDQHPSHSYAGTGVYQVELIIGFCGYADTVSYPVTVTNMAALSENATPALTAYPNPSADGIITVNGLEPYEMIAVFTLDGKLHQTIIVASSGVVTLSLNAGTYLLKTKTSNLKLLVL